MRWASTAPSPVNCRFARVSQGTRCATIATASPRSLGYRPRSRDGAGSGCAECASRTVPALANGLTDTIWNISLNDRSSTEMVEPRGIGYETPKHCETKAFFQTAVTVGIARCNSLVGSGQAGPVQNTTPCPS
ncbi:hypothetical protein SPHINGO391_470214 [Sphingomonas aurantiaca]|uniref:Uncharacterized protein n=1 Tax=Sphingomonas aurantiaca TaxID=185949 RepID=A0A5E7ZY22_9SPHN|nr:hypothetical protein SPHINGO391_470214 [Sphingomonas aurantiaca]